MPSANGPAFPQLFRAMVLALALFHAPLALAAASSFTIVSALQPAHKLKAGEFSWDNDAQASGELVVVADLKAQLIHVYRGGVEIGLSTISTGRKGYETPTGTFTILEKDIDHYSDSYDLSPMPYMQRLTWDGIALHGGRVPGYRASHGCIRMPEAFAHILYFETKKGGTVIVAPDWAGSTLTYDASLDYDPAALRMNAQAR